MASLKDTFTDADGTELSSHTGEEGATWAYQSGSPTTAKILTNRAYGNSASLVRAYASWTPTNADYDVTAIVRCLTSTKGSGAAGRMVAGADTSYLFFWTQAGEVFLQKRVAGSPTTLASKALAVEAGVTYALKLSMRGAKIVGYVDDVEFVSATDSAITEKGKAGFRTENSTTSAGFHIDSIEGADAEVAPEAPEATTEAATGRTDKRAVFHGTADPNGTATQYFFEYGTSESYSSQTAEVSAGSGSSPISVEATVSGLSPATTYHFRTVALSAGGEDKGTDETFQTLPALNSPLRIFLVGGQSNALGRGVTAEAPSVASGRAFEYVPAETTLKLLADPVDGANTGSAWPAFSNAYFTASGNQAVILGKPLGGTAQAVSADDGTGNWDASGTLYETATTALDSALTTLEAQGITPQVKGILWCQGERDAQAIDAAATTKTEYKAALEAMITRFRLKYGATLPFYVFCTGRKNSGDTTGFQQVRAAQDEVGTADPYTWVVFANAVNFPSEGKMNPEASLKDLHYSQAGYNEMGTVGGEGVVVAEAETDGRATSQPLSRRNRIVNP